jgi:hypothetical protein
LPLLSEVIQSRGGGIKSVFFVRRDRLRAYYPSPPSPYEHNSPNASSIFESYFLQLSAAGERLLRALEDGGAAADPSSCVNYRRKGGGEVF